MVKYKLGKSKRENNTETMGDYRMSYTGRTLKDDYFLSISFPPFSFMNEFYFSSLLSK